MATSIHMTKVKRSSYPEEWYCSYLKCKTCGTEFMCANPWYCPGCGTKISEFIMCDYKEMEETNDNT